MVTLAILAEIIIYIAEKNGIKLSRTVFWVSIQTTDKLIPPTKTKEYNLFEIGTTSISSHSFLVFLTNLNHGRIIAYFENIKENITNTVQIPIWGNTPKSSN